MKRLTLSSSTFGRRRNTPRVTRTVRRTSQLDQLLGNLDKLEKNEPVYLICHTGNRSKKAAQMLVDAGFPQAITVAGGTEAWKAAGLPMAR